MVSCIAVWMTVMVWLAIANMQGAYSNTLGPKYPITAAYFRDRWTSKEWQDTLDQFAAQGGDTVFTRAPPVIYRTRQDLESDPNFQWCGSYKSTSGNSGPKCYDEAIQELKGMGLNVTSFLTYENEEGYSDAIMRCPKLDRKINSSRIYFRIVLPARDSTYSKSDPCAFANGSNVVVLFTSFSGIDPHQLLLLTASPRNMSVYFGLPAVPHPLDDELMPAFYAWVEHVLFEHRSRFSNMTIAFQSGSNKDRDNSPNSRRVFKDIKCFNDNQLQHDETKPLRDIASVSNFDKREKPKPAVGKTLYDTLSGYNAQCDHSIGEWLFILYTVNIYELLGSKINMVQKKYAVSATINLNKGQVNSSVEQHVQGFLRLVRTGVMDTIIVQEGRGLGKGAYYWPEDQHKAISQVDPVLDKILHLQNKTLPKHATFEDVFITSNQAIFAAFFNALKAENHNRWETSSEFWLGLEAFEDLRDDPCLPIDPRGSGMDQIFNRATKQRLDQGIGVAGAKVQKIISMAWDPELTCVTNKYNTTLHADIMADTSRPIIANCSFHSPQNLSVVLIGFNLEGETQGFTVGWKDTRGHEKTTQINGYYFELDYGIAHRLVTSLQYVMLWDIPQMFPDLAPDGNVSIVAHGGNTCIFEYHLPEYQL